MGYAKPTAARLIDQRARRRATQTLIQVHRDEFQRLYNLHRAEAEQEAEHLATAPDAIEHYRSEPVRLMPGRRMPDQTAGDRIDVARCAHCVTHHDRGHVCTNCGAIPGKKKAPSSPADVAEDVEFLLESDPTCLPQHIAHRLGFADKNGLQVSLTRAGRTDLLDKLARNSALAGHGVKGRTA
jgi:hypothetical protein